MLVTNKNGQLVQSQKQVLNSLASDKMKAAQAIYAQEERAAWAAFEEVPMSRRSKAAIDAKNAAREILNADLRTAEDRYAASI